MDTAQYDNLMRAISGVSGKVDEVKAHLAALDTTVVELVEEITMPKITAIHAVAPGKVKDRNLKPMPEDVERRLHQALSDADGGRTIIAYCDGSVACQGSEDQASGSAAITYHCGHLVIQAEQTKGGTNNVGELTAIKLAMDGIIKNFEVYRETTRDEGNNPLEKVVIVSDSQYALNVIRGTFNATANIGLVEDCKASYRQLYELVGNGNIDLEWVRGHAGNPMNILADFYAGRAGLGQEIVGEYYDRPSKMSASAFLVECALRVKAGTALGPASPAE